MKRLLIPIVIISMLITGCKDKEVTLFKQIDAEDLKLAETKITNTLEKEQKEETEETDVIEEMQILEVPKAENIIYGKGEEVLIEDRYNLTILGVRETSKRDAEGEVVGQVLLIDYLYENINSEEDIYLSKTSFKVITEEGSICKEYPLYTEYAPTYAIIGAKTVATIAVGTQETTNKVKIYHYNDINVSEPVATFEVEVVSENTVIDDSNMLINPYEKMYGVELLEGVRAEYDGTFKLGDIIQIITPKGSYYLSIDDIDIVSERNPLSIKKPAEVYKIKYTYKNIDKEEPLYISEINFEIIDDKGNMGFVYPAETNKIPKVVNKGEESRAEMVMGVHKASKELVISFRDTIGVKIKIPTSIYVEEVKQLTKEEKLEAEKTAEIMEGLRSQAIIENIENSGNQN